jgi:hypothetical protein
MHVHRSSGGYPEPVAEIYEKMLTYDLAVVSLLAEMGNGGVQNAYTDLPRVDGKEDPISTQERILHWNTDRHWDATYTKYPHPGALGHIAALGLT